MRLSPILPVGLAVAAVALSASQGNTVAEPSKRSNHEVVAFPLFALKASDRILSSNNHYSHESHESHFSSHFSHDSHFSSVSSSSAPAPAPATTAPAPVVGSPTITPSSSTPSSSGSGSAAPVPVGSGSGPPGSGAVPSGSDYSSSPQPTGNTSDGSEPAAATLGVLVVTVGGLSYIVYRRKRRPR
jgi:hypothetical protein